MIIEQLQYRFREDLPLIELPIYPGMGSLLTSSAETAQGTLVTTELKVYLHESTPGEFASTVKQLSQSAAIYTVRLADDSFMTIGSSELRTRFQYKQTKADKPGGRTGYDITITWQSL